MAIYKPNNFYPHFQEVDMTDLEGNIFSCQANTSNDFVKGTRLRIGTPLTDEILYENYYDFNGTKISGVLSSDGYPVKNGGEISMKVKPYLLNANYIPTTSTFTSSGVKTTYSLDSYIPDGVFEYKADGVIVEGTYNEEDNSITFFPQVARAGATYTFTVYSNRMNFTNLKFITLSKNNSWTNIKNYCPFNFYLLNKHYDLFCLVFLRTEIISGEETSTVFTRDIEKVVLSKDYNGVFNGNIYYMGDLINDMSETIVYKAYITLKNNIDYKWECRTYNEFNVSEINQHLTNGTYITDGYLTGSTKSVLWFDKNDNQTIDRQTLDLIKKDQYVEIITTSDNSDIFEYQLKEGATDRGYIQEVTATEGFINVNDAFIQTSYNAGAITYSVSPSLSNEDDNIGDTYIIKNNIIGTNTVGFRTKDDIITFSAQSGENTITIPQIQTTPPPDGYQKCNIPLVFWEERITNYSNRVSKVYFLDNCKYVFPYGSEITKILENNTKIYEKGSSTYNKMYTLGENDYYVRNVQINTNDKYTMVVFGGVDGIRKTITHTQDSWGYTTTDFIPSGTCTLPIIRGNVSLFREKNDVSANVQISDNNTVFTIDEGTNFSPIFIEAYEDNYMKDCYCFDPRACFIKGDVTVNSIAGLTNKTINDGTIKVIKCDDYLLFPDNAFDDSASTYTITYTTPLGYIETVTLNSNTVQINKSEEYSLKVIKDDFYDIYDIKNFNNYDKTVTFKNNLIPYNKITSESYYEIVKKDRNQIVNISKDLGNKQNFWKIEMKDDLDINLFNNSEIDIYQSDDKNTKNSFFGVLDSDINVEKMHVRFPGYTGKDINGKQINDNQPYCTIVTQGGALFLNGAFLNSNIDDTNQTIHQYGKNVSQDAFKDNTVIYIQETPIEGTGMSIQLENSKKVSDIQQVYYVSARDNKRYDVKNEVKSSFDAGYMYDYEAETNSDINVHYTGRGTNDGWEHNMYGTIYIEYKDLSGGMNSYCKLYKVTSYDYETGEFVIAGGLEREILNTDQYEIWQQNVIEGVSASYDIAEVKYTYDRIYPKSEDYDKKVYVGGEKVFEDSIKIINNCAYENIGGQVFIQPNTQLLTDPYSVPYLKFDKYKDSENRIDFEYTSEFLNNYTIEDTTIEELDDSQWFFQTTSQNIPASISPGDTYRLYSGSADSGIKSMFYARIRPKIDVKYCEYYTTKQKINNHELLNLTECPFLYTGVNDNVVRCREVYFVCGIANMDVKRYRYKLYDSNMILLADSGNKYDNEMLWAYKGLIKDKGYLLDVEVESNNSNIINTSVTFNVSFNELVYSKSTPINLETVSSQNAIKITIPRTALIVGRNISIYRKNSDNYVDFVYEFSPENNIKTILDYNVSNNMQYEYFYSCEVITGNSPTYGVASNFIKPCFSEWSLISIDNDGDEDIYVVDSDIWKFSYNLESDNMSVNNNIAMMETKGKYPKFGYQQQDYITSGLSCLLGDVTTYSYLNEKNNLVIRDGYIETSGNRSNEEDGTPSINYTKLKLNNIEKFQAWRAFCNSQSTMLIRDLKGNAFIVVINEKPSLKNNDTSVEQMYTISFQWTEVDDSSKRSIVKIIEQEVV